MQVHRAILRRVITMLMAIALLGPTASLVHVQAPVLYLPFDGVYKTNANVDHECPFGDPCKDGHMTFYTGEGCVECQDMDEAWTAPYCYPGHSGTVGRRGMCVGVLLCSHLWRLS